MKAITPMLLIVAALGLQSSEDESGLHFAYIDSRSRFSHAVTAKVGRITTIYTSGQVGAGDDFRSQTRSAFENLRGRLAQAGAEFDDVVKMNTYIVDYEPSDLQIFREVRAEMLGDHDRMPAHTLVGIERLAVATDLIEIEVVAIIED